MLSELVFLLFCKMNAVTLHCQFLISNVVLPSGVPHSNLFHFLAAKRATRKKKYGPYGTGEQQLGAHTSSVWKKETDKAYYPDVTITCRIKKAI